MHGQIHPQGLRYDTQSRELARLIRIHPALALRKDRSPQPKPLRPSCVAAWAGTQRQAPNVTRH